MNSNNNIYNAFHVVSKTYEKIQKLMDFCKTDSATKSHYVQSIDKFLRYKSDSDISGWLIRNFITLYQDLHDPELENGWRNGPVYVLEIDLYSSDYSFQTVQQLPIVHLSKYEYVDIESWTPGCSPTNHWRFYNALRNTDIMEIKQNGETTIVIPKNIESSDRYYWGVRKITSKRIALDKLTSENAVHEIFGTFEKL